MNDAIPIVLILIILFLFVCGLDSYLSEISLEDYKNLATLVKNEPTLKPAFDAFFVDNKITGGEYDTLIEKAKRIKRDRELKTLFAPDPNSDPNSSPKIDKKL